MEKIAVKDLKEFINNKIIIKKNGQLNDYQQGFNVAYELILNYINQITHENNNNNINLGGNKDYLL